MSKFLKVIPLAIDIARIAEAAVPDGGKGKAKLAFAVETAAAIYDAEEDMRSSWKDRNAFLAAMTRVTGAAVSLLNAAGVFKKTAPAQ
jgi:hypothetical protein